MILHHYISRSGKDMILEYLNSLTQKEQVDGYSVLQCLQNDEMNKVKIKHWSKKVYEVYFYKDNRIFYVIVDENNMYLLHTCRKQKNKTEKKDKKIVEARAKELGRELGKIFI
ncbi:MAG: type II toxin-antitoxin system RelE/ParE family toxin [Acetivibrio ethanolgignens]